MPSQLLILAHPNADSFCSALAVRARESSPDAIFRDLYAENFDPLLKPVELAGKGSLDPLIQEHQRQLVEAKHLVAVFPDWWGGGPAILKGWVDRVWRPGISYTTTDKGTGGVDTSGLLTGLKLSLLVTSESPSPLAPVDAPQTQSGLLVKRSRYSKIETDPQKIDACTHPLVTQWRDQIAAFAGARLVSLLWCGPLRSASYALKQEWLSLAAKIFE